MNRRPGDILGKKVTTVDKLLIFYGRVIGINLVKRVLFTTDKARNAKDGARHERIRLAQPYQSATDYSQGLGKLSGEQR